jgi:hypothetical protein
MAFAKVKAWWARHFGAQKMNRTVIQKDNVVGGDLAAGDIYKTEKRPNVLDGLVKKGVVLEPRVAPTMKNPTIDPKPWRPDSVGPYHFETSAQRERRLAAYSTPDPTPAPAPADNTFATVATMVVLNDLIKDIQRKEGTDSGRRETSQAASSDYVPFDSVPDSFSASPAPSVTTREVDYDPPAPPPPPPPPPPAPSEPSYSSSPSYDSGSSYSSSDSYSSSSSYDSGSSSSSFD